MSWKEERDAHEYLGVQKTRVAFKALEKGGSGARDGRMDGRMQRKIFPCSVAPMSMESGR